MTKPNRSISVHSESRALFEPGHEEIVASLNNLSALYFFQEKHEEAEPICRQLTEIYENVLGKDHP